MRILFISWDAPVVNYVDSLFLPAFIKLKERGIHVDILQFRWGNEEGRRRLAEQCASHEIGYRSAPIWRKPAGAAGTALTLARAPFAVRSAVRRFRPDVIMPRGIFPTFAAMLAGGSKLRPMIFDSDGLEADSRVEGGDFADTGFMYRLMREIEAQATRMSEASLARTDFNAEVIRLRASPLIGRDRVHVMTCGRDPQSFKPLADSERRELRRSLGIGARDALMIYVGSVWPQYRTGDIARFAAAVRRLQPGSRLLLLTGQADEARRLLAEADPDIAREALVTRASPDEVPSLIAAADVGFSLFRVGFGSRAQSPIKLGEYLMCGVPVIGTVDIGETSPAIEAGVFFDEQKGEPAAANWLLNEILPRRGTVARTARKVGASCFSLERTVSQYLEVLNLVESRLRAKAAFAGERRRQEERRAHAPRRA